MRTKCIHAVLKNRFTQVLDNLNAEVQLSQNRQCKAYSMNETIWN